MSILLYGCSTNNTGNELAKEAVLPTEAPVDFNNLTITSTGCVINQNEEKAIGRELKKCVAPTTVEERIYNTDAYLMYYALTGEYVTDNELLSIVNSFDDEDSSLYLFINSLKTGEGFEILFDSDTFVTNYVFVTNHNSESYSEFLDSTCAKVDSVANKFGNTVSSRNNFMIGNLFTGTYNCHYNDGTGVHSIPYSMFMVDDNCKVIYYLKNYDKFTR